MTTAVYPPFLLAYLAGTFLAEGGYAPSPHNKPTAQQPRFATMDELTFYVAQLLEVPSVVAVVADATPRLPPSPVVCSYDLREPVDEGAEPCSGRYIGTVIEGQPHKDEREERELVAGLNFRLATDPAIGKHLMNTARKHAGLA